MNKHLAGIVAASLLAFGTPCFAATQSSELVGTWTLVAIEVRDAKGVWIPAQLGGRPIGMLMYDAQGNVAVQITTDPRPSASTAEYFEFANGYVAYFGTYDFDPATGTVTHHRKAHNNPATSAGDVVRRYKLSGDTLTLTMPRGSGFRLRWERDL